MKRIAKWFLLLAVVSCACTSIVMVDETECVVVERLGRIQAVYDSAESKGAHFKFPWPIDVARRFDSRIHIFDPPARELFTRDKKNITIDPFVCWKISGPGEENGPENNPAVVRFFRSLGTPTVAEARLDSQLRSELTALVGQVELDSLLNISNSEQGPDEKSAGPLAELSDTLRTRLQQQISPDLGIEIVDARIKRINFPAGNQQAVFDRMISERRKIADRYRAAGIAENEVIKSRADRSYHEILARADSEADRIRGDAEASAIEILREAHAADPEFFEFVRTLESYQRIFDEQTTLVLSASGKLFDALLNGLEESAASPENKPAEAPADADTTESSATEANAP